VEERSETSTTEQRRKQNAAENERKLARTEGRKGNKGTSGDVRGDEMEV
jgi:hypothetical protein